MPNKKRAVYVFLLSITMLLSACAATGRNDTPLKAYQGAERPASQLAVIKCAMGAKITAMDDNKQYTCNPPSGKLHVLPGQHTFDVWLALAIAEGTLRSKKGKRVSFKPTAGHTYFLSATDDKENKYKQDGWTIVILDSDTSDKGEGWILHPNKAFIGKK